MSINTVKFFNRQTNTGDSVDYIAMVNDNLNQDPTSIDPNSPIYLEAIKQYNGDLKKGNTTRLKVPKGFCGYIDPTSGEFRVTPDPDLSSIPPGQQIPENNNTTLFPPISEGEYPIDKCLQNGLAGSPTYSQRTSRETGEFGEFTQITYTMCGDDEDPVTPSGVNWDFIPVNYCIEPTPKQACMDCWGEGGDCAGEAEGEQGEQIFIVGELTDPGGYPGGPNWPPGGEGTTEPSRI